MEDFKLGEYRDTNGHSKPVAGVCLLNPDGTPIARNDLGLTPFEAKVISLLAQIRDRLPEPPKPAAPKSEIAQSTVAKATDTKSVPVNKPKA